MTDIVARLRWSGEDAMTKHLSLGMHKLHAEAADEIERLRSLLKEKTEQCAVIAETHPYELHMELSSFEACAEHVRSEIASAIRALRSQPSED